MTIRQFEEQSAQLAPEYVRVGPTVIAATASPGTVLYQEAVDRDLVLNRLLLRNTHGSAVTVTVEIAPQGGSPVAVMSVEVAANETLTTDEYGLVLDDGDVLRAFATTTNVITATWAAIRLP